MKSIFIYKHYFLTNKQTAMKMLFKRLLLFGLAALCFLSVTAQESKTVTGTITDADGNPVISATVNEKGTQNTVKTDSKGIFKINVKKNAVLLITSVGFAMQQVNTSDKTTVNVQLVSETKELEGVVVTALGIRKRSKELGYASSIVKPEEIQRTNTINIVNALQGKVPGVNINAIGTSGVTSSSSITIRGAKSIDKNNSPIFVVDGIVLENNITDTYGGKDWGSQLKNLNPDDYESITILKGAAATALYGSRGANGAIVITSKSGKSKKGLGVEFSHTYQIQNIYAPHVKLQNLYGAGGVGNGYQGGFLPDGNPSKSTTSHGPLMDGSMVDQYYLDGKKTAFVPHPDNWKALYQNGKFLNTNVSLNGGNDKATFRLSYSRTDNSGVLKNNEFKRDAISFKTNAQLNKIFNVDFGLNYSRSNARNAYDQGFYREGQNIALMTTYYMPRSFDLADFYKNYRDTVTNAVKSQAVYGTIANFLHRLDYYDEKRQEESVLANLALRAQITPNINVSAKGNYNIYNTLTINKQYGSGPYLGGGGYYGVSGARSGNYNFLFMIDANKKLLKDDLDVNFKVANEIYGNANSQSWAKGTNGGLITPGLFAFSNSLNTIIPTFTYTKPNMRTVGLSGILNLGWKNQLFLEITGRNDWISTLLYPNWITGGKNNWTVFYPSANLSWVFTDSYRSFIPELMSFGKLRASLSRVGMGTSAYKTSDGAGGFSQSTTYDQNRNSIITASPNISTLPNLDIKPEIQQSIELGTDIRFLNDRIGLDFTYYKTNTFNQILSLGTVIESGASSRKINAGNIQNQGIELQLDIDPIRTKDLRWNVQINYTRNRSKIIKLHPQIKEWQLMGSADAGPEIWAYENGAFGVITSGYNNAYAAAPAYYNNTSNPKDPRNGMRIIDYWGTTGSPNAAYAYGYLTQADVGQKDRVVLGKVEADFIGGINSSVYYKGFDFYVQADARVGGNFFSHTYKYAMGKGALEESLYGRDKEHGGIARINYKGETVYDGIMIDAVFKDGAKAPSKTNPSTLVDVGGKTYREAVESGLINPLQASTFYSYNYGWGANVQDPIMKNTWVMLREVTLGYKIPKNIAQKVRLDYARIAVSCRNLFYIYNGLKGGLNPESIQSNNPLTPYEYGGVPFSRNFSVSLNIKF